MKKKSLIAGLALFSMLLSMVPLPVFALTPVVNHTCIQSAASQTSVNCVLTVTSVGDLIIVNVQLDNPGSGSASTVSVSAVSDNKGNVYSQQVSRHINFPTTCLSGNCLDSEIWSAVAGSTGSTTITVTASLPSTEFGMEMEDVSSAITSVKGTTTGACQVACSPSYSTNPFLAWTAGDFLDSSVRTDCVASFTFNSGTGYTKLVADTPWIGAAEYSSGGAANPTSFPSTCTGGTSNWINVAVIFGLASGPSSFGCVITNMDAGNYLLPNGKVYDFKCTVTSNSISTTQSMIDDVQITFNDTLHVITLEYDNGSILQNRGPAGFKTDTGAAYVGLSTGSVQNSISGNVRKMIVDFKVSLNTNILDAPNRGIQLFALNDNFIGTFRGPEYVQVNYFNILNGGGSVATLSSGLCGRPAGYDTFESYCKFQASPKSWIATNSTWYQLQHYQAQFSLRLSNGTLDTLGCVFCWQDYANSAGGTENYANPGDWKIRYGLYYYDNSSWVKGINVVLQMVKGNQGTADQWTQYSAAWYNGNTLIRNDTFNNWIQQDPLTQTSLWVDLWYSNNNASTSMGGRIGSYYTGMHNSGFLWWSSWSPFLQNNTDSQILMPLKDHTGKLMPVQQAQFSRVFMNMSRPYGNGALHGGNYFDFTITSRQFKVQEFQTTNGPMAAVPTPPFNPAVVPIIQNTGFLSPIINALAGIGKFFINGLQALGNIIWTQLATRFPWFTGFWASAGGLIVNLWLDLSLIIGYLISFLGLISNFFGPVITIINIIGAAWATIQGIYLPIFTGANLSAIITLAVVWIFSGWVLEHAEKGDTGAFYQAATAAWRIMFTFLNLTWMFAKLIIDAIEGLIP
jgi:hypothetical protein